MRFNYDVDNATPELGVVKFIDHGHWGVRVFIDMAISEDGVDSSQLLKGLGKPTKDFKSFTLDKCEVRRKIRNEDGRVYGRVSLVPFDEVPAGITWSYSNLDEIVSRS